MQALTALYARISERLNTLCFESFYPGFHRFSFALYTNEFACLHGRVIPRPQSFHGNTAILYGGEQLAIWNVELDFFSRSDQDEDTLCADIVHEMFHAYQTECAETRFPDDLLTLCYPLQAENFALHQAENAMLASTFAQSAVSQKRALLAQFCTLRARRRLLIGDMLDCELLTETIEGMAEYIGLCALRTFSPEKGERRLARYIDFVLHPGTLLFNVRRMAYYTGTLLLVAAQAAGINFVHALDKETQPVYSRVAAQLPVCPDMPMIDAQATPPALAAYLSELEDAINAARAACTACLEGRYRITGYDPMNMVRLGDTILCRTFVQLVNLQTGESRDFSGLTLLIMEEGSSCIARAIQSA